MSSCCAPKPESAPSCNVQDLTDQHWAQSIWTANYVALGLGWLIAPWRPYLWTAGLVAAGVLCIVNAFRCGRLHCHITGPLFLIGAVLTVLKATGFLSVSWSTLGVAILLGTTLAYAAELVIGKYARRGQGNAGVTR